MSGVRESSPFNWDDPEFIKNYPSYGVSDTHLSYSEMSAIYPESDPFFPILSPEGLEPIDPRSLPVEIRSLLTSDEVVIYIDRPKRPILPEKFSALRTFKAICAYAQAGNVDRFALPSALPLPEDDSAAFKRFEDEHSRDALISAMFTPERQTSILEPVLISLASQQGLIDENFDENIPFRQERIGEIMLVSKSLDDPVARKFARELGWGYPLFTSIDATPQYINALAKQLEFNPKLLEAVYLARDLQNHSMGQSFELAARWLTTRLDENSEGLLEFKNRAPRGGMINQAWSDSAPAYMHANGEWANHNAGIAAVEVQGYAYDALMNSSRIYEEFFGNHLKSEQFLATAETIKRQVLDKFWTEDEKGGYFVLGTDRDENGMIRQLQVRSANMGLFLGSKMFDTNDSEVVRKVEATIRTLFSEDMLGNSIFRSLSSSEVAFNPGGDHTGNRWLWVAKKIADNLGKGHGYYGLARHINEKLWEIVQKNKNAPEYIRGDDNPQMEHNQWQIYVWNKKYKVMYLKQTPGQLNQTWSNQAYLSVLYDYPLLPGSSPGIPKAAQDPKKLKFETEILENLKEG